jgi:alanine dehydrogenase
MKIGLPKEIKDNEYRVGLTPAGVNALTNAGHEVYVQKTAGEGSGFSDELYVKAGGKLLDTADEIWQTGDMIVKVKEPIAPEYPRMRENQLLFTYLHLAPEFELTKQMMERKVTGVAYETITDKQGRLPLLTPMSEVAGRMSVQVAATYLEKMNGGKGILLGGVPGVPAANVVIIGGGDIFLSKVQTLASSRYAIHEAISHADVVIGGVLVVGAAAPKLVTRDMLKDIPNGSVLVDVAVDQGGCFETTHATTHSNPTFYEEGVLHYCVANMPGAVPRTSTFALTNATLPYALSLANKGFEQAIADDAGLKEGVNTYAGKCTYEAVAESQSIEYTPLDDLLNGAMGANS